LELCAAAQAELGQVPLSADKLAASPREMQQQLAEGGCESRALTDLPAEIVDAPGTMDQ